MFQQNFENTHTRLPRSFDHTPINDDWRQVIEELRIPPELLSFCRENPKMQTWDAEHRFQKMLDAYLVWLPSTIPPALKLVCEAIILQAVLYEMCAEKMEGKRAKKRVAYLGASTQHRMMRVLPHLTPEDHRRLFYDVCVWFKNVTIFPRGWKSNLVGSVSVVQVIKACLLTREECTLFAPNLFEDVFGSIDLCIELPMGGLYVDVKTFPNPLQEFRVRWMDIHAQVDITKPLAYNAVNTNARYDHLWFPIKIQTSRDGDLVHDSRVTEKQVRMMRDVFCEARRRFLQELAPPKRQNKPVDFPPSNP
ncbi:TPA: hypothetical protein DEP34_04610 [Candidatus Uhrbacteria bacterium]|uniref:Uncharacterized protein n=2 Tax=Candidatus Uhriibacteriota TaxID=1752732 RepID=A0A0G1Q529_9BACT|nr:MAG: hypothetical protein UX45_C0037G0005 [Candidatus Uhrbacteria bacterium GW2011_GWF2_46_218]KKU40106.1 MAG: hypothetical protein UX57_C0025G0006 [Candidatus Uhrbacteria bacterium GW2011_GWE2_46_68]HBK34330.1 hypothetical protein [Candidatus Uhrbacteria bacterium]HCB19626.1 hypothetical protein [Candidatus Uhrbacteria bacterium]